MRQHGVWAFAVHRPDMSNRLIENDEDVVETLGALLHFLVSFTMHFGKNQCKKRNNLDIDV